MTAASPCALVGVSMGHALPHTSVHAVLATEDMRVSCMAVRLTPGVWAVSTSVSVATLVAVILLRGNVLVLLGLRVTAVMWLGLIFLLLLLALH